MKQNTNEQLSRRNVMKMGGKFLSLGLALPYLVGRNAAAAATLSSKPKASTLTKATSQAWASGGTELITVDFPATNVIASGNVCTAALSEQAILGPCYFATTTGEDISQGRTGVPMQLCLRLIDSNCNPLSNYKIEVWHCDTDGLYSGDTSQSSDSSSFRAGFCTDNDATALKSTWYRGVLSTDQDGRVNFKTCFPGWYHGRTIHIHVAVVNAKNQRDLITQVTFKDSLSEEIFTGHELYSHRGNQDTPLSGGRDGVFPAYSYDDFVMTTSRNSDGSMLAYHTLQLTNV